MNGSKRLQFMRLPHWIAISKIKNGRRIPGQAINLRCSDVGGLLALGALNNFEGNLLAFLQRLEAAHVDGREVCEQIFTAVIGSDETETFCIVKPFDYTSCHVTNSLTKNGNPPAGFSVTKSDFFPEKKSYPVLAF
jgi:hypothetical protein